MSPFQTKKIYSHELGIKLETKKESELFKWFLACLLFGKPIQQEVAKMTYFEFIDNKLTTPARILDAGWHKLVSVLDKGHYARFDYSTATKLLEVCRELKNKRITLTDLIKKSKNPSDLSRRLQEMKHIGPVTASIFVRDIKLYYWNK